MLHERKIISIFERTIERCAGFRHATCRSESRAVRRCTDVLWGLGIEVYHSASSTKRLREFKQPMKNSQSVSGFSSHEQEIVHSSWKLIQNGKLPFFLAYQDANSISGEPPVVLFVEILLREAYRDAELTSKLQDEDKSHLVICISQLIVSGLRCEESDCCSDDMSYNCLYSSVRRFSQFGLQKHNFEQFGLALLQTLDIVLGDHFNSSCRQAWTNFWAFVSHALV